MNPLIVIIGPTAVGKTEISLQLAERLNGEIVSADSRLFYRGMDIGTAKPSKEDQTRIKHHLIDIAEPDQIWSLAKFQRGAYAAIDDILSRGKNPFMVGGTGQYVWAVVDGWEIPAVKPDYQLRNALQDWADQIGAEGLHDRLSYLDSEAARRIEPQNIRRSIRALEVIFLTGKRFSGQTSRSESPYRVKLMGINLPRKILYERIDSRIQVMFEKGLVTEVESLLTQGYSPELPPLSAIGYRHVIENLQGKISKEEAIAQIKRQTRQFVRRQANWFKTTDPRITWFA